MKKNSKILLFCVAFFSIVLLWNCTKKARSTDSPPTSALQIDNRPVINFVFDPSQNHKQFSPEHILAATNDKPSSGRKASTAEFRSAGCGGSFSGSWGTTGYHQYPADTIRLDTTASTATIKITVNSYDVPDRFTVRDASGNAVASSAWMGYATYSGPWGMSLNTPETGTLSFTRGTSAYFTFIVETSVSSSSDSYNANINCYP